MFQLFYSKLNSTGDRVLTLTDMSWSDYKRLIALETSYRISYWERVISIVTPGRNHERIAETIRIIIVAYCRKFQIPCWGLGSETLKEENVVGKQPDVSYCFGTLKPQADLAIEVKFALSSLDELEKYRRSNVPEVWIWQQNRLYFYSLRDDKYTQTAASRAMKDITSQKLTPILNLATSTDDLTIEAEFLDTLL